MKRESTTSPTGSGPQSESDSLPLRTVQETPTFDNWLKALEGAARGPELVQALDVIAQRAMETFGARLWFVRILGRRWSYVAGYRSQTPAGAPMERIRLGDGNLGLVSEGWGRLSNEERVRLIAFLGEMVAPRRQP